AGNWSPLSNVPLATTLAERTLFFDDMEAGTGNWTITGSDGVGGPALWHLSSHRVSSPTHAMYYGKESTLTYNTGLRNQGAITSRVIDLTGMIGTHLDFKYFLQRESCSSWDLARLYLLREGNPTPVLLATLPANASMVPTNAVLTPYDG